MTLYLEGECHIVTARKGWKSLLLTWHLQTAYWRMCDGRGASLPLHGSGSPGFSLGLHWQKEQGFFFFFFQWCMARVGMVIVNKISILLVCPFLISLTQESGFSFYILFVSFGISGSWVFQYLVGDRRKDESQRITTVGCFSTVSLLLKSLPYPLPLCLLESSFICFMYRSSLTNDVVLFW